MLLSEQTPYATYQINGYESDTLLINQTPYQNSILIAHNELITDWRPKRINELLLNDFERIDLSQYEILLIGTGLEPIFAIPFLPELKIGYEIMNTLAACRTFNLLANEGRAVIAALFLI
jgi:uncharacterized protein